MAQKYQNTSIIFLKNWIFHRAKLCFLFVAQSTKVEEFISLRHRKVGSAVSRFIFISNEKADHMEIIRNNNFSWGGVSIQRTKYMSYSGYFC